MRAMGAALIRADRRTDKTKLVGAFHDYARNVPKKTTLFLPENCGWTNYKYQDLPRRAPSVVHKEQLIENRCLTSYQQPVKRYDSGSRRTFVLTSKCQHSATNTIMSLTVLE